MIKQLEVAVIDVELYAVYDTYCVQEIIGAISFVNYWYALYISVSIKQFRS